MKKTIRDFDMEGKKVIIRVDFNVPMIDGVITDDTRIKASLPTIEYALAKGARVILLSHLGRVKTQEDLHKNSLESVAFRLSELLDKEVIFVTETRGNLLENEVKHLENGQILLVENTRFEDLNGSLESKNDPDLGKYWASLGDIFINDAFGTCHRCHASNVGISKYLPTGVGFLIEKELKEFSEIMTNPQRPYAVILGGAKVEDKIGIIENLIEKVDYLLIGGGMSYTFLKAKDFPIGKSMLDEGKLEFAKEMLKKYEEKIILPVDHVVQRENQIVMTAIKETKEDDIGYDIGDQTLCHFKQILQKCKTVLWNGPVGMFEKEDFEHGTVSLLEELSTLKGKVVLGGGDTSAAAEKFMITDFSHISTGGGASLSLLEGKTLPGIECIDEA